MMYRLYKITGKVQGVFYRKSAKHQADKLGITGWVRNLANGNVEVMACGSEAQLTAYALWLAKGPKLARVTNVEQQESVPQNFDEFSIK